MKIKFKRKRLHANLIIGIVWSGLGFFNVLGDDNLRWTDYGYLLIGLLYIGQYIYDLTNQYLTITNGNIWKNRLYGFRKKISLNEIKRIKNFAGDYTLITETKELKINTELIDKNSLIELNSILGKLNLSADKNPFAKNV